MTMTAIPDTASTELPEPNESELVSCPLCHTTHPSLTRNALNAGGDWQCTRCGQRWDAKSLATVVAYGAWVAARTTTPLSSDAVRPEDAAPRSVTSPHAINDAAGVAASTVVEPFQFDGTRT